MGGATVRAPLAIHAWPNGVMPRYVGGGEGNKSRTRRREART